ncbi:MAG TPA: DUF1648 domain-containing protein [Anaerolineae bacterium]|nr:DUF1648 domain-containing protein [Caldilineae bacterium]HID34565.1 DUF1648 domain-containing protein [Anaerolineae bacterium]HIQ11956.1 DUF1648 domain-containing protein [Caldilineales bacterium]
MSFRPLYPRDRIWAGLLALALLALTLLTLRALLARPVGPGAVILGGILLLLVGMSALLIYRLWSLHSLDYWVQRDAIHILWNGEEVVVPLDRIQRVERAARLELAPHWRHWPLPWVQARGEEHLLAYATQPAAHSLAIVTQEATYLISPADPDGFILAYEQRRDFGPARKLKPVIYLAHWRQHWLLRDRWAQGLLLGGLLLGLILLAYAAWHYPQLPATIALHFGVDGHPDWLSPRRAIFLIPGVALLIGFLNAAIGYALYLYRRFLAYLLWSASVVIQVMGLFIAIRIIALAAG